MNKFQQGCRIFLDTGLLHQQFRGRGKQGADIGKALQQGFRQRFHIPLRNGESQQQFHDLMRSQ